MNLTKKITLALGLLAAGTSFAQEKSSNGLLGQRFAEFNFSFIEIDNVSTLSYEPGLRVNLPLIANSVDVGATYDYAQLRGPISGHANSLSTYAVGYVALDGVKPFVAAALAHTWSSLPFGLSDNSYSWSIIGGFEVPVGPVTLTPTIGYSDDFDNGFGEGDVWTYRVEGNYWMTPKAAIFAGIAKVDTHRDATNIWTYDVGLRFRF